MKKGLVIFLILIVPIVSALDVTHTMNDFLVYDDYIDYAHSENIDVSLGRYWYSGDWTGFRNKENGRVEAVGGSATLITRPYNLMNSNPELVMIDVSGQGNLQVEVAGADDNGNHENVPAGSWTSWNLVGSDGKTSLTGKQFLKFRISIPSNGYVEQITIKYNTTMRDHPRLFVDDLVELRQRCVSDVAEQCAYLKEFADASSHYSEGEWQLGTSAMIYALEYVISDDASYATKAYEELKRDLDAYNPGWSMLSQGPAVNRLMITYDWIFNALTPAERASTETKLIQIEDRIQNEEYHHSEFNNHLHIEHLHVLLAGIAMYDGQNNEKAQEYLDIGYDYLFNHNVPAVNRVSEGMGGWHESMSYFSYMAPQHLFALDGMRTATGVNFFEFSQGLRNMPNWYLYSTIPHDNSVIHLADNGFLHWPEDTSSASGESKGLRGMFMVQEKNFNALGYTDDAAYAQHIVEDLIGELYQSSSQSLYRAGNIYDILWYNPDDAKNNIPDQALTGYSPRLGEVIMREGNGADDTLAMFHCGDYYGGHAQADNGHFSIWYKGYLAVDSGYYTGWGSSHHFGYSRRTVAHNTLTIYKPGEEFSGTDKNDGGQNLDGDTGYYGIVQPGTENDACNMEVYSTEDYDYINSDFTKSYKGSKVNLVTRQFIFLRPDMFIVFDRIRSTDPSYKKKYLLHSQNDMTVSDNLIYFTENQGKLFSKSLLPIDPEIVKVGGSGQEWSVEGTNFAMGNSNALPYAGRYRAEISPPENNEFDVFLHVMQVTDSTITEMADTQLLEQGNMVGAKFGDYVVLFSRDGSDIGQLHYSISGSVNNIILNLKPGYSYYIEDNGVGIGSEITNDEGLIEFTLGTGEHDVLIYEGELVLCTETCTEQICSYYDDCIVSTGFCENGSCCTGSCTAPAVCLPYEQPPCDNCYDLSEIQDIIDAWYAGDISLSSLFGYIGVWKNC